MNRPACHSIPLLLMLFTLIFEPHLSADTWSQPFTLGVNSSVNPSLAVDSRGNAVAVFVQSDDTNMWVKAATQPAGGSWSTPVSISQPTPKVEFPNIYASVAIDLKGNAIAIWNFPIGDMEVIQTSLLNAGSSTWTPAETLSPTIQVQSGPQVAFDANGNALAVWSTWSEENDQYIYTIESARMVNGSWTPIESYTGYSTAHSLDEVECLNLAVAPTGNAVIIWTETINGILPEVVKTASLAKDDLKWSLQSILSLGNSTFASQIAIDSKGNEVAIWSEEVSHHVWNVKAAVRPAGTTAWKQSPFHTDQLDFLGYTALALDDAGNAYVAWVPNNEKKGSLLFSQLSVKRGTWSTPVYAVPANENIRLASFAVDPAGNALVFWENYVEHLLKASTLPTGSKTWTPPVTLASGDLWMTWPQSGLSGKQSGVIIYDEISYPDYFVKTITGTDLFSKARKAVKKTAVK